MLALLLLALVACKNAPPPPTNDEKPATGTAPVSAKTAPAAESAAQAFCEKTMSKLTACFDDEAFWEVFSTTYFAKYPDSTGNPDAKKQWIGMRKDDIANLKHDNALTQNCAVMVANSLLPTDADMAPVNDAMTKTCTDFGTAMGFMLFHKGIFHKPR